MQSSRDGSAHGARLAVALLALPAAMLGCAGPVAPPPPPGGGQTLLLSYDRFGTEIEPILVRHGCDASGDCHGGGIRGTFRLSPPGAKNPRFDFDQAALQVWPADRDGSPLLTEPLALAAGGTPHGVKPFADTADSDFVAIRNWIRDAEAR